MNTETKCLEYARECSRVTDPELRERLFNISRRWTERATREALSQWRKPTEPSRTSHVGGPVILGRYVLLLWRRGIRIGCGCVYQLYATRSW
jgi:hypothetical protein